RFHSTPPNVHLHTLANSGHWVHVDNPDGLLDMLTAQ
ncbi:MAG: pimeloyl-ACP methyl ester carboxylesterase, partial [Kiritimatiellia bacterium]